MRVNNAYMYIPLDASTLYTYMQYIYVHACIYICIYAYIFLILVIYIICFAKPVCDLGRAQLIIIYLFTSLFLFYLLLILNIAKIVARSCEPYRADTNNITAVSLLKTRTSLKQNALIFHSTKDADVYR